MNHSLCNDNNQNDRLSLNEGIDWVRSYRRPSHGHCTVRCIGLKGSLNMWIHDRRSFHDDDIFHDLGDRNCESIELSVYLMPCVCSDLGWWPRGVGLTNLIARAQIFDCHAR